MKTKSPSLILSLAVLLTGISGAHADGTYVYADGSTKDIYAGVPVPAPAPVPMKEAQWYVRLDIGGSTVGSVDIDVQGNGLVIREADDIPTTVFGEGGFGYRFNKNFRMDFTSNFHDSYGLSDPSVQNFVATVTAPDPLNAGVTLFNDYNVERTDKLDLKQQSTNLVNFYYDFANGSRFTPYVGVGVGVTYVNTSRRTTEEATCFDGRSNPPPVVTGCHNNPDLPAQFTNTQVQEEHEWLFSGALMGGFSYDLNDYIAFDASYRALYMPGSITRTAPTLGTTTTATWEDFMHHQIRTGLRIKVF